MLFRRKTPRMERAPLPGREYLALLLLLYLAALPLFSELPWRISLFITLLYGLAALGQRFPRLRPGRLILLPMTLGGVALVLQQFHTLFGYQAGMALFALMLALKAVETRSLRDLYVLYLLGLFMMVAQFLLHQGMPLALGFLTLFIAFNAVLIQLNRGGEGNPLRALRLSGIMLGQAVPLALILFLLFPRLSSPLWNIDVGARAGVTGLSNFMEPGSVNQLILSQEPVFRVEFDGPRPPQEQLYWRGPVFWDTDGRRWSGDGPWQRPPELQSEGKPISYLLIMEGTGKPWIPALDLPASAPPDTLLNGNRELLAKQAAQERRQYRLTSYLQHNSGTLGKSARRAALALPAAVDPRVRELAAGWRGRADSDRAVVDQALAYFNREPFVYTLSPPRLGADPVAEFLFETRAGFCEHYSSSFTVLMRAAGIPSRIVTGYLGGEQNDLGDYTIVRQSDAHAWSEVWLPESGWTRIDPTAAVAPERVLHGIVSDAGETGAPATFALGGEGLLGRLGRGIGHALDALNTNWHIWVLSYGQDQRSRLLSLFGLDFLDEQSIGFLMVGLTLVIVAILYWILRKQGVIERDPVVIAYERFCRRLAGLGTPKRADEGPLDYAARAATIHPKAGTDIRRISDLYIRIRYRGGRTKPLLREFKTAVKAFRPRR